MKELFPIPFYFTIFSSGAKGILDEKVAIETQEFERIDLKKNIVWAIFEGYA